MTPPAGMTPQAFERVRALRARVHQLMPEAVQLLEALRKIGLVDGWRDVQWAGTTEEAEARRAASSERVMSGRKFHDYCREAYKWIT